jgi:hypothetical protein
MAAESPHRTMARLAVYLDDIYFPCSRLEILKHAEDNEAPDVMLDAIEELPDRSYWSIRDILARIGGGEVLTLAPSKPPESVTSSGPAPELVARQHAPMLSPGL